MASAALQQFLNDRNLLAIKVSSSSLGGFLRRRFTIPASTAGLVLFPDGAVSLVQEGREVGGKFQLTLAKVGMINMRLIVPDLPSKDGLSVSATVSLSVRVQTRRDDLFKDFIKHLFNFPGAYTTADLKSAVAPELRKALASFVAQETAADLHKRDRFGDCGDRLGPELERFFFGTGIRFEKVADLSFSSQEYEKKLEEAARREQEERERQEREERRQQRLTKLTEIFGRKDVREILSHVRDDRMKGILYARLMEEDSARLSASEIAGRLTGCGDDVAEAVYRAMEGLLSGGAAVDAADIPAERADRIYAALGSKVVEIDPAAPRQNVREFAFREPLRSVCLFEENGADVLVAGSKRAAFAIRMEDPGRILEFPLPQGRAPRGGVNAMARNGSQLFATHSEYGLVRWDLEKPCLPGEIIHEDLTKDRRTTRAVQVYGDRLFFASGAYVHSVSLDDDAPPDRFLTESEGAVTGFAIRSGRIFAGTEDGTIVMWKLHEPENPTTLLHRRDSILRLRLARMCSIPHLVYSSRDLSVRARVLGQNLETAFETGGATIGVIEAASDLVCATDGPGRRIFLWKSTAPTRPDIEIDGWAYSQKPILDLWMKRTPVKG